MLRKENGNLVIEASLVMTLAGIFIVVLVYLGLIVYQRTIVSTVANDSATQIAQIYALSYRDPFLGYIDEGEFYNTELYRYVENLFDNRIDDINSRKAEWFAYYRLKKAEILKGTNPKVSAEIIKKPGTLIQHQVVVTIEATYKIPLTSVWGGDNGATFKATGRADCFDILDYCNTVGLGVDFIDAQTKDLDFLKNLKKLIEFINKQ